MADLNPCCPKCLYFITYDEVTSNWKELLNEDRCHGVQEYSSETTGHMHCFQGKDVNEKENKLQRLKIQLENVQYKIPELQAEEKELIEKIEKTEKEL